MLTEHLSSRRAAAIIAPRVIDALGEGGTIAADATNAEIIDAYRALDADLYADDPAADAFDAHPALAHILDAVRRQAGGAR